MNRKMVLGDPPSIHITALDFGRVERTPHSGNGETRTPSARRSVAERPSGQDGYMWSTPKSFAFFAAVIILALVLAEVLKVIVDVNAR